MSYEGYCQVLCENGHQRIFDLVDPGLDWRCPEKDCGKPMVWWNMVDQTNGSFGIDENGNEIRIDGYIELQILENPKTCEHCGNLIGPHRYKIPQGGHLVKE